MRGCYPVCRAAAFSMRSGRMIMLLVAALLCGAAVTARAQISGTKTIGGSGADYPTIEAALGALNASGVSGPVTFLVAGGTYAVPASGYPLRAAAGMSATNTVTIRPAANATAIAGRKMDCMTREPIPKPACATAPKSRIHQ